MSAPFKRFVVHTNPKNPNVFDIYVSDLEGVLLDLSKKDLPSESDVFAFALKRALFIEQVLQKAIDEQP